MIQTLMRTQTREYGGPQIELPEPLLRELNCVVVCFLLLS